MNETVKAKWLSALRSGEYNQDVSALHKEEGGFCCLGVLCAVAVKENIIPSPRLNAEGNYVYGEVDGKSGSSLVVPEAVSEWANLPSDNPWVNYELDGVETNGPISNPNDEGRDFQYIASLIEDQL